MPIITPSILQLTVTTPTLSLAETAIFRLPEMVDPLSGDVFIFFNKRKNLIKLLAWQGDGFAIFYKRLEKGTYEIPEIHSDSVSVEITCQQLLLINEGIRLSSIKKCVK